MNPHKKHPASLYEIFSSFWKNRELILQMTKREVLGRYRGSFMGLLWSLVNPIVMLCVYTFVFSGVFKARWDQTLQQGSTGFAIMLFVGMTVFGLFAECISRAPTMILSNVNLVKKVVFPLEILPWVSMGSALFHTAISLGILLIIQFVINHSIPWTAILFPVIFLPLVFGTMGVTWFISSTSVFVRDISQVINVFITIMMFLSAVFYPVTALPEAFRPWLKLNPLVTIIEESRKVLILGQFPDWTKISVLLAVSLAFAWAGFWWFQRRRKGFSDVI